LWIPSFHVLASSCPGDVPFQERFWFAFFAGATLTPASEYVRVYAFEKISKAIDASIAQCDGADPPLMQRYGEFSFLFAGAQYRLPEPFRTSCKRLAQTLWERWREVPKFNLQIGSRLTVQQSRDKCHYSDSLWALHAANILGGPDPEITFQFEIHREWIL
jgi:hypothetical protein